MKWDDLSIKEKVPFIIRAAKSGITNIDEIASQFNNFADGGPIDELSPTDSLAHEEIFRTIDPSWGVPKWYQYSSARKKINDNRKNPDYHSEGTQDDNAYFRNFLNLPYDESRLPKSQYKPTITKDVSDNTNKIYYGLNDDIQNGVLSQLDTVRTKFVIDSLRDSRGFYGNSKLQKRVKLLEEGQKDISDLFSGKKNIIQIREEYNTEIKEEKSKYYPNDSFSRYLTSPLKDYTVSISPDGSYISVYDKYDFPSPAYMILPKKDKINEFEIYDRIPRNRFDKKIQQSIKKYSE